MKYKIELTEEQYNDLTRLLEERIEAGGEVETVKTYVMLLKHLEDNYQED